MNDERFESLLADYLTGELSPADEPEFRAELERNEQRRNLARSLQATAAALEADVPDLDEAEERSAAVPFDRIVLKHLSSRKPRSTGIARVGGAALRYAAVILLAFAAGYSARQWQGAEAAPPPVPTPVPLRVASAAPAQINDEYIANYARAARKFPQATSFSRALLAVASRGR